MGDSFQTQGAFSWCELCTNDLQAAGRFYGELFGWELEDSPMPGTGGAYVVAKVGGRPVGGMMTMPPNLPPGVPPHWGVYVTVDDVDATVAEAARLGGKVHHPPTDIPGVGRFAVLSDPQGAVVHVIKYASRPA